MKNMTALQKRELVPGSLLEVSSLAVGCAPLGNLPNDFGHEVSKNEALNILTYIFKDIEVGINFLDTSRNYGESEDRIGEALQKFGDFPVGLVIATKADRDPVTNLFEPFQIRKSVQESLKRLGLTSLPLVYLHDPEKHPDYSINNDTFFTDMMNGAVRELETMRQEGLIQHIGISGGPIDMLIRFVATKKFDAVITHNRYNLLYQNAKPLLELAKKEMVSVINAGVFASGILVETPRTSATIAYRHPTADELRRVTDMREACKKYGIPLDAAALQFSLWSTEIISTAVGISSTQELQHLYELLDYTIPDELWVTLSHYAIHDKDPETMN